MIISAEIIVLLRGILQHFAERLQISANKLGIILFFKKLAIGFMTPIW
jgi:hypothetical protein